MGDKIDIIVADSYYLSRKGLSAILSENKDFNIIAEAQNVTDLLGFSKYYAPNLIIIDYTSSNYSINNIPQIVKKFPTSKLLAITDLQPNGIIAKSLNTGITSHLLKECEQDEIIEAVYKTAMGERFLCGKIPAYIMDDKTTDNVTAYSCKGLNISEREMEIITLVAEGFSNKEIADKLFLSTHTVTTHRKNIMNKLGVNNAAGLVLFAVRENLVSPNHFLFSTTSGNAPN